MLYYLTFDITLLSRFRYKLTWPLEITLSRNIIISKFYEQQNHTIDPIGWSLQNPFPATVVVGKQYEAAIRNNESYY